MHRPEISIVTPSYRQCAYLREAMDSVRLQQGVSVEHVICDGGSDDGTRELLEQSAALWVSEPDSGQSEALNKGFAMAGGDIIGWLNADDFYLEGALKTVVDFFAAHPEADVVYGDCLFVDGHGRLLRAKSEHGFNRSVLLHYGCFIPSTATFFRRRLLESRDLRIDEDLHYVMDYEFFVNLAEKDAKFAYLSSYLAAFRWHDANKSLDDTRRRSERNLVQDRYGVVPRSPALRQAFEPLWRARHLAMKVLSGGWNRQRSASADAGHDVRWWPLEG